MNCLDQSTARDVSDAIHEGDIDTLTKLLRKDPTVAHSGIRSQGRDGEEIRSLLHVVTDYPGHFPRCAETITLLVAHGSDPNARFVGPHAETPLHWAVSCDDVEATDALIEAGANLEADGGVLTGGSPMDDAVIFAQWNAARRLMDRGATLSLWHAGALGVIDEVRNKLAAEKFSDAELTSALWHTCLGGQLDSARLMVDAGADIHWVGFDNKTPLDCAIEGGNQELVIWLESEGAKRNTR